MRIALALTTALLLGGLAVLLGQTLPAALAASQPAKLLTERTWQHDAQWFGGLSGIDTTPDGMRFVAVTDRGHIFEGDFIRSAQGIADVTITRSQKLRDKEGQTLEYPHTDAEGVALTGEGSVLISFEIVHRILQYDDWAIATWPSYTRSWRALWKNRGMEALAVDENGTVFAIPEGVAKGATVALVFRRSPGMKWEQPFTLPLDKSFKPVGADFGPDGLLYVLERDFQYGAFQSQVRRFAVSEDGLDQGEMVLQTALGQHGNLEGLAVWRDKAGRTRLTMVSDNNFKPYLRMQLVEYAVEEGLAGAAQSE